MPASRSSGYPKMLHAKAFVADGEQVLVGTCNLEAWSLKRFFEIDIGFVSADLAAQFDEQFFAPAEAVSVGPAAAFDAQGPRPRGGDGGDLAPALAPDATRHAHACGCEDRDRAPVPPDRRLAAALRPPLAAGRRRRRDRRHGADRAEEPRLRGHRRGAAAERPLRGGGGRAHLRGVLHVAADLDRAELLARGGRRAARSS